jgi:hypothetical protein
MGGIVSMFDGCGGGPDANSPAAFMDQEMERDTRNKTHARRKKMDVMGTAMDMAMSDIR